MNRIALDAPDPGERRDDGDAWQGAAAVDVPTLVMIGEYDLDHTQGGAVHLGATMPGARLVELPGVAHLPHLERDPLTLREIAGFVAAI
jgi:pimeloyl-ACP methyl ester carboxylesterase